MYHMYIHRTTWQKYSTTREEALQLAAKREGLPFLTRHTNYRFDVVYMVITHEDWLGSFSGAGQAGFRSTVLVCC